jgi:hypothetical protein
VRGNQARVKNADLRHSSFTVVMQKRKKTQICVTRPQCVKNIQTPLDTSGCLQFLKCLFNYS